MSVDPLFHLRFIPTIWVPLSTLQIIKQVQRCLVICSRLYKEPPLFLTSACWRFKKKKNELEIIRQDWRVKCRRDVSSIYYKRGGKLTRGDCRQCLNRKTKQLKKMLVVLQEPPVAKRKPAAQPQSGRSVPWWKGLSLAVSFYCPSGIHLQFTIQLKSMEEHDVKWEGERRESQA